MKETLQVLWHSTLIRVILGGIAVIIATPVLLVVGLLLLDLLLAALGLGLLSPLANVTRAVDSP